MLLTAYRQSSLHILAVILGMIMVAAVQANDQVRFSTGNNLLTIPYAIIDQQQSVFDAQLQLQSDGVFVLTKISDRPVSQVDFDEPFVLDMDQTVWLKDTNTGLKLTAVTEDSRCPIDARCIQIGTVNIVLSLFNGVDHARDFQLSINSELNLENFRIKLLSVEPESPPISLKSSDYNATFVITNLPIK